MWLLPLRYALASCQAWRTAVLADLRMSPFHDITKHLPVWSHTCLMQATMIVFTSASASIVFLSFGGIPTDYAVAVFIIGAVFTMLGQV